MIDAGEIETIHRPLMKWLDDSGIPYVRARSDRESTIQLGHPDFSIFKNGGVLFIEAKGKDTPISQDQKDRIELLTKAGNVVVIARSLASAVEAIQTWQSKGIVRNAALGPAKAQEWAIAQDGSNGDFLMHRHEGGQWTRNRRATFDDVAKYPRIYLAK